MPQVRRGRAGSVRSPAPADPSPTCVSPPAIKFPPELEASWILSSLLGFTLDVLLYHTLSLFAHSLLKLLVG